MNLIAVVFIWIGWALLGIIVALLVLFLFCLSVEIIIYLLRKTPLGSRLLKPLTSSQSSYHNGYRANYCRNKANLTNNIKNLVGYFLLFCCPLKRPPHNFQTIKYGKEQTQNGCNQSADSYPPIVVNKELPNNSQHSNTNVSQGEKACQPKVNDTHLKLPLTYNLSSIIISI